MAPTGMASSALLIRIVFVLDFPNKFVVVNEMVSCFYIKKKKHDKNLILENQKSPF